MAELGLVEHLPAGPELRPVTPEDTPFLQRVYASTREAELARVPWDEASKQAFLQMQFAAQDQQYRQSPDATFEVIRLGGQDVGRLSLDRSPGVLRIMDIALLPEWRGQGLGTEVLQRVIACATLEGREVQLYVEAHNPAGRLYARLGFQVADPHPIYTRMTRPCPGGAGLQSSAEDGLEQ